MLAPSELARARTALGAGRATLLHTELVADLETPVSIMLKLGIDSPYHCLLESVEGGNVRGRFSVIALNPDLIWRVQGDDITTHDGDGKLLSEEKGDALAHLRRVLKESQVDIPDGLPPMSAGLFGYFGYEMIRFMENVPTDNPDDLGIPDACFMRPQVVVIFDRLKDNIRIATPLRPDLVRPGDGDVEAVIAAAEARLKTITDKLKTALPITEKPARESPLPPTTANMPKAQFLNMVKKAIDYIKAGIFSKWCCRNVFPCHFQSIPLRSIGHCGGSTLRLF